MTKYKPQMTNPIKPEIARVRNCKVSFFKNKGIFVIAKGRKKSTGWGDDKIYCDLLEFLRFKKCFLDLEKILKEQGLMR